MKRILVISFLFLFLVSFVSAKMNCEEWRECQPFSENNNITLCDIVETCKNIITTPSGEKSTEISKWLIEVYIKDILIETINMKTSIINLKKESDSGAINHGNLLIYSFWGGEESLFISGKELIIWKDGVIFKYKNLNQNLIDL